MSEMAVMGREGDTKVTWNAANEEEVATAKAMFDSLVSDQGFAAFSLGAGGGRAGRVTEFDPEAERLVMAPRMQGG